MVCYDPLLISLACSEQFYFSVNYDSLRQQDLSKGQPCSSIGSGSVPAIGGVIKE